MSQQQELRSYIARLQGRLRVLVSLRGAAALAVVALTATVVLALLLNHYAFPARGVTRARVALPAVLFVCAALAVVLPLIRLTRKRAVERAEAEHPELEQRLTTFFERTGQNSDPFLELLAADTLRRTEQTVPPSSLAPWPWLLAFGGLAMVCAGVLVWLVVSGPGYLGYGASLLWTGPKKNLAPLYALTVTPGDVAVRRHSDQLVSAQIKGLKPEKVQLFARFQSAAGWEPVTMLPQLSPGSAAGATGYGFVLAALTEGVEYYVSAGPLVSPHYTVRVVDLPAVKSVQVTYHYPKWTGLKAVTEDHAGDLRALEGTDAALEIEMDRPITGAQHDGELLLDNSKKVQLTPEGGNRYKATVHMEKDGAYHVAAVDAGQAVRLSEDYFIATDRAAPPEVAIDRPGRDYRASPIEEVTVGVKADDAFGVRDMRLHYSVNGGPEREVNLLKAPGAKSAEGSYTVRLEDFKLVPGDLVSLYATARDGHAEARTDMSFIQADPFEREFSQSQQSGGGGGGGGGGGNNQTEISKREKELIAATWKQVNDKSATGKDAAAQGQFLADAQNKLRDQVMALSARMGTRDLSSANEEFSAFEKDMEAAASTMAPSVEKLKGMAWKDALPLEQKTLQSLLRAEATFRQIQVASGQQSGGGGGGGGSAGRDLASLFDLELDTEKNQYETAQTASPAEQHAKDVESALEKLDALAKRQEELASQQHTPQQSFAERWQQEMLRREAEQLQREMQQLAENNSGQNSEQQNGLQGGLQGGKQSGQAGSQGSSSAGSAGSSQQAASSQAGSRSGQQRGDGSTGEEQAQGQAGGQSGIRGSRQTNRQAGGRGGDPRITEALSRLRQAGDAMKRSGGANGKSGAAQQAAAERLREAAHALGSAHQQLATGRVESLSHEADRLAQEERAQAERIGKLASRQGEVSGTDASSMTARMRERNQLAGERQQLSNDLSALQKGVRDAARQVAPTQPGAAGKLRDASTEMDQSDLDNHVQRTADWLRRGVNPNSNGTEGEIAQGLQKLAAQLHQAQQGMGQGGDKLSQGGGREGTGKKVADEVAALGQVERLRSQLEAMAAARRGSGSSARGAEGGQEAASGQHGQGAGRRPKWAGEPSGAGEQAGRNGSERSEGALARGQSGRGEGAHPAQDGPEGRNPQQLGKGAGTLRAGQAGGANAGPAVGAAAAGAAANTGTLRQGEVRSGGGSQADGTVWGNVNTGNNTYAGGGQHPAPRDASGNPADSERSFQQGMRELSGLRQALGNDPAAAKELNELTRQMQRLDPKRFPGNPAMVEQMHREVLSAVDRLELQLNRDGSTDAHTGRPAAIPPGYEQSVANYYRELSAKH